MRRWRGPATVLAVCAVVVAGAIAALLLTRGGHEATPPLRTTGGYAPITVVRPKVPVIAGGIAVDLEPLIERKDLGTALTILPGVHRYKLSVSNVSTLGAIHSFQWYPPTTLHIVKLLGNTGGACALRGLKGFGGNQFPTLVLHQNVLCDRLDLAAPSCTCRGDGGTMTISFATDKEFDAGDVDLRVRTATLVYKPIPTYLGTGG
jgi:hypothetical protein